MRTSEDQKSFVNSTSGLKDYEFTFETKSYKLGIANQDSMWSNYVNL